MRTVRDVVGLALAGVRHRWGRAALLALALSWTVAIPAALAPAGATLSQRWGQAAATVPVVVGARGAGVGLVLATVVGREGSAVPEIPWSTRDAVEAVPGVVGVPWSQRGQVAGAPLIGIGVDGPSLLGWTLAAGRGPGVVGEVVLGAAVAHATGAGAGDTLVASGGSVTDPTGGGPLRVHVVGVWHPTGTAVDHQVTTSLETVWALQGRMHGHAADQTHDDDQGPVGDALEASLSSFDPQDPAASPETWHLHGDRDTLPIHAVLAFPDGAMARDRLLGRLADAPSIEAVEPARVVAGLLDGVARVAALVRATAGLVAAGTALLAGLVVLLVVRERQQELAVLRRLGASRLRVAGVLGTEAALIAGVGLTLGLALGAGLSGPLSRVLAALAVG